MIGPVEFLRTYFTFIILCICMDGHVTALMFGTSKTITTNLQGMAKKKGLAKKKEQVCGGENLPHKYAVSRRYVESNAVPNV